MSLHSPTSSQEWASGELYRLPSGKVARLKQPGLFGLIAVGYVPNPILTQIAKFFHSPADPDTVAIDRAIIALARGDLASSQVADLTARLREQRKQEPESDITKSYAETGAAVYHLAKLCLVEPKLVDENPQYDQGEIGPGDLSQADYWWIASQFVEGRADGLFPFRFASGAETTDRPE